MLVREVGEESGLGAGSVLDSLGLTDTLKEWKDSFQVTQDKLGAMADGINETLPYAQIALVVATVALGAMAIFAFVDFMDLNPFRRK